MNSQCIVYVTDENYFFPTAISALQARKAAHQATDVVIVTTEAFHNKSGCERFCQTSNILLLDGSQFLAEKFAQVDRREFGGRVSIAAMGRLLLSDLLPDHYRQVIYIDGDTQIVGDLTPLEEFTVPKGKVLAAPDYVSIIQAARKNQPHHYFNSGVLKFDPKAWIGKAAFDYFVANGGHLHDQGALNTVAGDSWIRMSNRWNFPRQFLHLATGQPTIIHFASHPKPWDGVYFPCSAHQTTPYVQALREHEYLRPFVRRISLARRTAYKLRSLRHQLACQWPTADTRAEMENLGRVVGDWSCDRALFAAAEKDHAGMVANGVAVAIS